MCVLLTDQIPDSGSLLLICCHGVVLGKGEKNTNTEKRRGRRKIQMKASTVTTPALTHTHYKPILIGYTFVSLCVKGWFRLLVLFWLWIKDNIQQYKALSVKQVAVYGTQNTLRYVIMINSVYQGQMHTGKFLKPPEQHGCLPQNHRESLREKQRLKGQNLNFHT